MNRSHVIAALATGLAAGACSDPASVVRDALNLDRPVDVSFACYGGLRITGGDVAEPGDPVIDSAQPAEACAIRSRTVDQGNVPLGQEQLLMGADPNQVDSYAFVLQSVPGTVGIARMPNKPAESYRTGDVLVIDADPLVPGKNGITVGSLPVAIATDTLGCHVVTANAGSCDLSVLTVDSVLDRNPAPVINRVGVSNGTTPILAKPAAMIAEPPSGTIGVACEETPTGLFYVAYPGCHTVAALTGDGVIQQGIQFAVDGTATIVTGDQVSCPVECGDMRDTPTIGPRPVAFDILTDPRSGTRRMVIGAEDSPRITIVELDPTTNAFVSLSQIPLEGDIGILDIAISPEIGVGGTQGLRNDDVAAGGQFQFVYAVATDGSVRVADILNQQRECDTQIDPRFIHDVNNIGDLSCLPLNDPTLPRRALARGPGIEMIDDSVAISVRIFGTDGIEPTMTDPSDAIPGRLVGYFALIGTSRGGVLIANIDDDSYFDTEDSLRPMDTMLPLAIAHQLRDAIPDRDRLAQTIVEGTPRVVCDTNGPVFDDPEQNAGGPRLTEAPVRFLNTQFVSVEKAYTLPYIRSELCTPFTGAPMPVSELGFAASEAVREAAYPDLRALRFDEEWSLVWEGSVSRDGDSSDTDGPPVRLGIFKVGGLGMRVEDPSHPYCSLGIEPNDIVAMRGCDPNLGDAQCPTGHSCYVHPDSQVSAGSCLPTDAIDSLSAPCRDFLRSIRRYSVKDVETGMMTLEERPRVLRTTPLSGCVDDNQCQDLYLIEQQQLSDQHLIDDTTMPEARAFRCEPDPSRNGTIDRCVMHCDPQGDGTDCDDGTICNPSGVCVEGPIPPLQCVEALQRYEVRVGDAFSVIGSTSGFQHPIIADASGKCIRDPDANPLLTSRIPLDPPACLGDGLTDLDPNPCTTTVQHAYFQQRYVGETCTPASPASQLTDAPFPAIRFRNPQMTFHVVEPTYRGDQMCRGDRLGTRTDIPVVFPGLTLQFEQVDGLVPLQSGVAATFPVRIVPGPQNSLWVVDEGDFLSTSTSTASTRGKVFRLESVALGEINTLQ
jgi:hypothetical protein